MDLRLFAVELLIFIAAQERRTSAEALKFENMLPSGELGQPSVLFRRV